jgi:hypothetical protein
MSTPLLRSKRSAHEYIWVHLPDEEEARDKKLNELWDGEGWIKMDEWKHDPRVGVLTRFKRLKGWPWK